MKPKSSLQFSPQDTGKVLSKLTEGNTQDSKEMKQMIVGRFEEIMGLIEGDIPMIMMVHTCMKNPNSTTCLKSFREALLRIIIKKEMTGGEKSKSAREQDEDDGDPLGVLGNKINILYLDDWHSEKKIAEFCALSVEFINLFTGFYDLSDTEEERSLGDDEYHDSLDDDEDDDEHDSRDVIKIHPYDMNILKVMVSAAQSYLEYLHTYPDRLLIERDSGRWYLMRSLVEGLRGLSFQVEIGKGVSALEYKYFNTIMDLLVKWDVTAMNIQTLAGGDKKKQ